MIPVWPKVKLKSLYHGLYDGPHATPKESEDGAVFLGIKNVTEDGRLDLSEIRHIAEEDLAKWTKRVTPSKDDIVFSYEATLHRYARIPEGFRGCLGRRMALIRPDKTKVDINYLFSYFLSPLWRAEVEKHILSGATVDRIPLTNVPEFELFLPSLQIQKKVSAILSSYDDLIGNNLKRIKLLEEMAQITYEEWFVRMKFPGHENAVFDEETGLPEGWEKRPISDFCEKITDGTHDSPKQVEQGVPLITGKHIENGFINFDDAYLISQEDHEKIKKRSGLSKWDILFSNIGTLGNTGVVTEGFEYSCKNVVIFKRKPGFEYFLYSYLANEHTVNKLDSMSSGVAQKFYSLKFIRALEETLPGNDVIDKFNKLAEPILTTKYKLHEQIKLLKEARDILLPRLMTGMIDIEQVELPEAMLYRLEQQEDKMATAV